MTSAQIGTPITGISAPRGTTLTCQGWPQEAAYRMLQNNLDPEVAENPDGSGCVWRNGAGGAFMAGLHGNAPDADHPSGRRDDARAVGQTGWSDANP